LGVLRLRQITLQNETPLQENPKELPRRKVSHLPIPARQSLLGELKHWPQWMQDYLRDNAGKVEIIATHPARWVKVSVVEGGRCAN
jgi:hypothetical protein